MENRSPSRVVFSIFLSIILVFFLIPVVIFVSIPFLIYREAIIIAAKLLKRDEFDAPVAPLSAAQGPEDIYRGEGRINSTACLLTLRGPPDIEKIRRVLTERVFNRRDPKTGKLVNPVLSQNVVHWCGYPFWRRLTTFDEQENVHAYQNDENFTCTLKFAEELTKKLTYTPFRHDKPVWEIIILPNLISDDSKPSSLPEFGIIFLGHHVLTDGFNLLRTFQQMSDTAEEFNFIKPRDYLHGLTSKKQSYWVGQVVKWVKFSLRVPKELAEFLADLILNETWRKVYEEGAKFKKGPLHGASRGEGVIVKKAEKLVDVSNLSKIKEIYGVSGTSVLFSAIAGAVRNSIFTPGSHIPGSVLITTPLPLPSAGAKLENSFTMGFLNIGLANPDPVARLKQVHAEVEKLKGSTLPGVIALCLKLIGCLPRSLIDSIFARGANSSVITVSNLAGPKGKSDVAGHELLSYNVTLGAQAGAKVLGVYVSSIRGKLQIKVSGDVQTLHSEEKADLFVKNFEKELEYLLK